VPSAPAAREIRGMCDDIPIVLMSGYGHAQLPERARAVRVCGVMRKPLGRTHIADTLARALAQYADRAPAPQSATRPAGAEP
jgi:FixJ family two-component response regulator